MTIQNDEIAHLRDLIREADLRYQQRFDASEKAIAIQFATQIAAVNAALAAADRAVQKAEAANEKRFESVNEFRGLVADQQRTLMPREESMVLFHSLTDKIDKLEKIMDGISSERLGIKGGWGYAVGVIGVLLALMSLIGIFLKFAKIG